MIKSLSSKTSILIFVVGSMMFVLGVAAHRYQSVATLRYHFLAQMNNFVQKFSRPNVNQYSYDVDRIALDRTIDTSLLPIKIRGVRLSDRYPVAKVGGAIATIANTVLVLDRLGNLYACSPAGEISKLSFPPLPNGIVNYLAAGMPVEPKIFRALSMKYMSGQNLLLVSHEAFDSEQNAVRLTVSAVGIDRESLQPQGTWKTIFLGDPAPNGSNSASGGRLVVNGHDKIYLTTGDYLMDGQNGAQDPNSTFGKIFELGVSTKKTRLLSMGHRNPQGLVITRTGELISTEHGPMGGDELNLISEGSNYGWPNVTLGTDYNAYNWKDGRQGRPADYRLPIFAWVPDIAVSNLIQVEGFSDRWDGDLLVASLKALSLFRLRLDGMRVLYSEPIWLGQRIRDLVQVNNGVIALWTDDAQLLFISVDEEKLATNKRLPVWIGESLISRCMFCHHFGPTSAGDVAPSLSGLFERRIASDNFRYSSALRAKEGIWTETTLRAFLSNPGQFASGTSMPPPNPILEPEDIDEITRVLKRVPNVAK
jgi:cytochrome c2